MSYLLSVVIPTKDRYIYLKECLKTLVDLKSEELEIVVQDNTLDNSEIVSYIQELNWSHIKYFHSTENLSQTGNSDYAIKNATGEYCCYIGDDDSLTVAALEYTRYLRQNNMKACVCNVATYHWPDVVFEKGEKPALSFDDREVVVQRLNSEHVLKKVLSYGVQDIKYLPRVYHAIIAMDVMQQIYKKTGSYFPGPSPDMANAISAALLIDEYIYVRKALIVSGYSYKSAGGMGLRGAHKGDLKSVKQLPKNAEKEWSPKIPKVWLGYTVWPESAEKAFTRMGAEKYIKKINYYAMEAKIFLRYAEYRELIFKRIKNLAHLLRFGYECCRFMTRWCVERLDLIYRKRSGKQCVLHERISLTEACKVVNEHNMNGGV